MCIATNAAVSQKLMIRRALARVGFDSYFTQIYCYTELGYRKDELEFWAKISADFDVPLTRMAMIGDSYQQDYLAPRSLGLQTILLRPQGVSGAVEPEVLAVSDLREFSRMVKNAI